MWRRADGRTLKVGPAKPLFFLNRLRFRFCGRFTRLRLDDRGGRLCHCRRWGDRYGCSLHRLWQRLRRHRCGSDGQWWRPGRDTLRLGRNRQNGRGSFCHGRGSCSTHQRLGQRWRRLGHGRKQDYHASCRIFLRRTDRRQRRWLPCPGPTGRGIRWLGSAFGYRWIIRHNSQCPGKRQESRFQGRPACLPPVTPRSGEGPGQASGTSGVPVSSPFCREPIGREAATAQLEGGGLAWS